MAILLNKAKIYAKREGRYVPLAAEADADNGRPAEARFRQDGHWVDPPRLFDSLDPERIVAGRELWRHVDAFIEELPPAQRAVMIMRDVEGKEAAETCQLLELSSENQRIMPHRARTKVRDRLASLIA